MDRKSWFLVLAAIGCALGCGMEEEITKEASATAPPIDLATGKTIPALVGTWVNPDESYQLNADGKFKMHFDRMEQNGPNGTPKVRRIGDLAGRWSATNDALLLSVESGPKVVLHKLTVVMHDSGATLELRPTFMKKGKGMMYVRQKVDAKSRP